MIHGSAIAAPYIITVEPPPLHNGHLFFCPLDSFLNLSTTATKARPAPTIKITSPQQPVFSVTDEKVKNGHEI